MRLQGWNSCSQKKEVFVALSDLGKEKVLGLDGYTIVFWLFS